MKKYIYERTYALYRGEDLLSVGTIYEIAKEMRISVVTVRFYLSKHYKKRLSKRKNGKEKNQRMLILIED